MKWTKGDMIEIKEMVKSPVCLYEGHSKKDLYDMCSFLINMIDDLKESAELRRIGG